MVPEFLIVWFDQSMAIRGDVVVVFILGTGKHLLLFMATSALACEYENTCQNS